MSPLEQLILNKQFEKNASVRQYASKAPAYLKSLFTPQALRETKNIFFSYPSQIMKGPVDIYNKGLLAGVPSIANRFKSVMTSNPSGAPIAFIAPKIIGPAALSALALKGDSSKS